LHSELANQQQTILKLRNTSDRDESFFNMKDQVKQKFEMLAGYSNQVSELGFSAHMTQLDFMNAESP
jgi:hypothetical protein